MAESNPPPAAPTASPKPPPPAQQNPAFRMMGLPALPSKLPSRNWIIFWTLSISLTGAIVYDRREKKRATARWAHAVEHLAKEPLVNQSQMPRKVTIYLESPPGDGLRVTQDHYTEYVRPILAASGLDWEFVQGRQQGDIRAAVAERVRRRRRRQGEIDAASAAADSPAHGGMLASDEERLDAWRQAHGVPTYDGVRGDIVIGRHTWKEYVRGLHEGWLGPLNRPPNLRRDAEPAPEPATTEEAAAHDKPKRPPQIQPFNSPEDYATACLPPLIPPELAPSTPIPFPHILGFLNTPTRFVRFLNRRRLADEIGREVAAVCFCSYREYREESNPDAAPNTQWEQQSALAHEEKDWVKSVWKEDKQDKDDKDGKHDAKDKKDDANPTRAESETAHDGSEAVTTPKERIWPRPVVIDARVGKRMRRFELLPDDEVRARNIVVPEEEIEGWTKRSLRSAWRWAASQFQKEEAKVPTSFDD